MRGALFAFACLGFVLAGCIESDDAGALTQSASSIVVSADGTEFEVEVVYGGDLTSSDAEAIAANVTVVYSGTSSTSSSGDILRTVRPHFATAADHGFYVEVRPRSRVEKLAGYRWDFVDINHAQGFCPGM